MIARPIDTRKEYRAFEHMAKVVYRGNPHYRGTEGSVEKMLLCGPTDFHKHATVDAYLLEEEGKTVGRFALIHDQKLPGIVQVSFFEALPELEGVLGSITDTIDQRYPDSRKFVIGLNGHLNYGAGILVNEFDMDPVFGLPYSQPYYTDYFRDLDTRKMFSFRLPMDAYIKWSESYHRPRLKEGLTLRFLDKRQIRRDIATYTWLNNHGFQEHPYWADRTEEEDMELFYPFRFLLRNEHMVLAEYKGEPAGFFLWYPDFNQLVRSQRDLNAWDVLRFRFRPRIDTCRFTEIGVLPKYLGSPVALTMMDKALPYVKRGGFKYCEVGFIFEENRPSMAFCKRILTRCRVSTEPYRHYALFEGTR